ncbi:FxSxx-COOH system tetratricopeptide repeat protein [Actinoplanes sp. L3-i22]|uniref:FxSxx-COOH system tetratricopeptide repeat protein n=1 Tax=Actinoplanes sp. L3-i22 TaxID=2836373 RepID=UPI001C759CC3|nr:FxSxx-COOH system tetratricopeptide repeat protein [Actinoplanes sp. L3-i22]BCY08604.1 hypothetical protein L3i22_036920 [Actinoplanes sp. L3-i22]
MSDQHAAANPDGDPPTAAELSLEQRSQLRDALDAITELEEPGTWRKVLNQVKTAHGSLHPQHFAPAYRTFDILEAAIETERGLVDLAMGIRLVLGRTPGYVTFTDLVKTLQSDEAPATPLDRLRRLLAQLPASVHAEVLAQPGMAELAGPLAGCSGAREALDRLTRAGGWTLDAVRYVELAGRLSDQNTSALILGALDRVVVDDPELGDALTDFRASLTVPAAADDGPEEVTPEPPGETPTRPADGDGKMITLTLQESDDRVRRTPRSTVSVWGGVAPRNSHFAGRDSIFEAIRRSLHDEASPALVLQAVHGYGGVGKTQIATEYAYRYADEYDLVWWVPADEPSSIRRSLVSLARRLGLPESVDAEDTIGAVLDALRQGETHERWLLIFDNAGAPDTIQEYRPRAGRGHVLVTSRSNRWLGHDATVSVDVFTEPESVQMLRKRWPDLSDDQARRLAGRLGHLPLALEQAAAVHIESGMTLEEYLTALDETPTRVLREGTPEGYSSSVALTFQIAYRELASKSPAAAQLFAICALMSSQPISVPMLIRGRGAQLPAPLATEVRTEMTRRNAIRDMAGHALATLDPGRNLIQVHSLVRDLLRDELSEQDRQVYTSGAHSILALANPGEPDVPENWQSLRQISPHVVPSGILFSPDPEARTVFLDQIRYLYSVGDYAASQTLGEMAVTTWSQMLGVNDIMTLVANRHLANSLRAQGEFPRAAAINKDTLERMTELLGATHEHTLATANSVGADLRIAGDFRRARERDEANLAAYQEKFGDNDPATQRSANNLAVDLRLLGRFEDARQLDESIVRTLSDMFGEDDVRMLWAYSGVARDLYGLGRYAEALSLQISKLRIHESLVDLGHLDVLRGRRNEAILLRKNGLYGQALETAESALLACQAKFGETHDHTFAARLTLANTLRVAGKLDEAEEYALSAAEAYRINLGGSHPFTLAAMVDVAIIHRLQGRLDEALKVNGQALETMGDKLGLDHQWRLCALANQAGLYADQGRVDEALRLSRDVCSRSERVRGEDHPYTLAARANLSLDLEAKGEHIEASAGRRGAITRLRMVLGDRHPEVINVGLSTRTDADIEPPAL